MKEIVLSSEEIQETIKRIAKELEEKFKNSDKTPIFVGVLKGALPFMMDLVKYYEGDLIEDFIQVSSYEGTASTGVIHLKKDLSIDVKDKDLVIIEDIIDTGTTLSYLKQYLQIKYQPRSITLVTLLDKKPLRKVDLTADIVGVTLTQNEFLVGYGFDYNEIGRNYDFIFVPTKKQLETWDKLLNNDK